MQTCRHCPPGHCCSLLLTHPYTMRPFLFQEPNMSTIMGTPDYMAPQLLGPKASNCAASYDGTKADIWAAGVMLCVMLLGRFPFEGTDMAEANDLQDISMHVRGGGQVACGQGF